MEKLLVLLLLALVQVIYNVELAPHHSKASRGFKRCVERNVRVIFEGGDRDEFMLSIIRLRTFLMSGTECWKTSSVSIMDSAKIIIKDAFAMWSNIGNGRTVRRNVVEELKNILKANGDELHKRDNTPVIVLFLKAHDLNVKDLIAAAKDLQETGFKFIVYGIGNKLLKTIYEPIAVASKRVLFAKDFGSVNYHVLKILLKNPDHEFPKTASFSNAGEKLNKLHTTISQARGRLLEQNFTFISGDIVREWLIHFGANPNEMKLIEEGKLHYIVEKDYSPTMSFRQLGIQRNLLINNGVTVNGKTNLIVKDAGARAILRLYDDEIASSNQDGATLSVDRVGVRDLWAMAPKKYVAGTVNIAFSRMMNIFLPDSFTGLPMTNPNSNVTIHDQLLIRINKMTDGVECPSPEGIHQDGVQITAVTLTGSSNLESGGETRIWPLSTPKGNYKDKDFDDENSPFYKKKALFNHALRNHWDTIILNDRTVKHEGRPFDGKRPALRDVIVSLLRKPYLDGMDKMLVPIA